MNGKFVSTKICFGMIAVAFAVVAPLQSRAQSVSLDPEKMPKSRIIDAHQSVAREVIAVLTWVLVLRSRDLIFGGGGGI